MPKTNPAKYGHHSVEQGDSIQFVAGAFKGAGKVKSVGRDGAVVTDETGRDHNIHWHEVNGRGGSKPVTKPKPLDATDAAIQAVAPEETSEQELRRKIPPRVLAKGRRQ